MQRRFTLATATSLLGIICALAVAQDNPTHIPDSLAVHCFDLPFIGIYARTRNRDATPAIQLLLTDPLGRTAGEDSKGVRVPDASYGEVVQLPSKPQHSKALAVEICNANAGTYEISVAEKSREAYVLDVTASGKAVDSPTLLLHHIAKQGRMLHYRFTFHINDQHVFLTWLDTQGRELREGEPLEINDW